MNLVYEKEEEHFLGGALELHKAMKQQDRLEVKKMAKKQCASQVILITCFMITGKKDKYH